MRYKTKEECPSREKEGTLEHSGSFAKQRRQRFSSVLSQYKCEYVFQRPILIRNNKNSYDQPQSELGKMLKRIHAGLGICGCSSNMMKEYSRRLQDTSADFHGLRIFLQIRIPSKSYRTSSLDNTCEFSVCHARSYSSPKRSSLLEMNEQLIVKKCIFGPSPIFVARKEGYEDVDTFD